MKAIRIHTSTALIMAGMTAVWLSMVGMMFLDCAV